MNIVVCIYFYDISACVSIYMYYILFALLISLEKIKIFPPFFFFDISYGDVHSSFFFLPDLLFISAAVGLQQYTGTQQLRHIFLKYEQTGKHNINQS